MGQPIRIDNQIQRDVRSELVIIPVSSDLRLFRSKSTRVMTTDLKAAHYVLFNSHDFPKPELIRKFIEGLFGSGAFCCKNLGDTLMTLLLFI